jgi:hypothetical protein
MVPVGRNSNGCKDIISFLGGISTQRIVDFLAVTHASLDVDEYG